MRLVLLLALLFVTGCRSTPTAEDLAAEVRSFYGPAGVAVLSAPDRAETWSISSSRWDRPAAAAPATRPAEVDPAAARELAAALLDAGNFDFFTAKGCIFRPDVGFRFYRAGRSVEVRFCFTCGDVSVKSPDGGGLFDFGPGEARIKSLVDRARAR
ncbi:MAG: hypothetical protein ACAI43_27445 [Phycisphaerae bacterium]|nr:hypothetical protein [Tepidisphaeraceae bacterium]